MSATPPATLAGAPPRSPRPYWQGDRLFRATTRAAACGLLGLALAMGLLLTLAARPSIDAFGWRFLISSAWNPVTAQFGALTAIVSTLLSTAIALAVALPVALGVALFLEEICPAPLRSPFAMAIELLAAIPSIVYGMWGLFVLAPLMADHVQPALQATAGRLPLVGRLVAGPPMGIGMLTAGLVLGLMILPFIASVSRDVLAMVPQALKESAYGMGATPWEVVRDVMLPYGRQGLFAAGILGLGRAIGETMAVTFVIGNAHRLSASLFAPGNSIASTLANEFTEADGDLYFAALIELGLILFVITFFILGALQLWLRRLERGQGGR